MTDNLGDVRSIRIEDEMRTSYLDYAMSVIVARALPDVRDGLKPVHRRILYTMGEMGLSATSSYRKCAAIVGEVMGKLHPHGDAAIYDALVRLAQDFSMRYPLIDGQGNFGSVDGDSAAAMRYTEARLAGIAAEMLADIDKQTVDFAENYDGQHREPTILPARLPNLLVNGSSGIAVGMATNIPPHHLGEVVDATIALIDDPELTSDDLCAFVKGPDFPTGGSIFRYEQQKNAITGVTETVDAIRQMYAHGHGRVIMRAQVAFEEARRDRVAIIVTELPYQVNKATLLEKIADMVKDKRIDGIADLRDESDRDGMRIYVEVKNDANPHTVLNNLFKHTAMQLAFNLNMLALVDGQPQTLPLKSVIAHHVEHRQQIVRRRTEYDLSKARERAHVLEGLKIALDHLDEVIRTIRESADVETARANLIAGFGLSDIQAQAILDMRLARLAALERKKIEDEYLAVIQLIAELEDILANPARVLSIIKDELLELKRKYAGERRTRVVDDSSREMTDEDLIADEDVVVTISRRGYIKRQPVATYRRQGRGGKGIIGHVTREEDAVDSLLVANTHDWALFFTNRGRVFSAKVHSVVDASRQAKGIPIINLPGVQVEAGEVPTATLVVPDFTGRQVPGHGHAAGRHQEDAAGAVREGPLVGDPGHHARGDRRARLGRRRRRSRRRHHRHGARQARPLRRDRGPGDGPGRGGCHRDPPGPCGRRGRLHERGTARPRPPRPDRDRLRQAGGASRVPPQAPRRAGRDAHPARGAQDRAGRRRPAGDGARRRAAPHQRWRPGRADGDEHDQPLFVRRARCHHDAPQRGRPRRRHCRIPRGAGGARGHGRQWRPRGGAGLRERSDGLVRGSGAEEAPVYSDSFDVYTGNANKGLATKICRYLGVKLGQAEVFSFANENIFVKILDNVREKDVFLVQPTCRPVNQSIMELLIMIDAFKRASAGRITAVIPYYAYGRSDKKDQPRVPITARLVADMITVAGADRVLSMDLHQGQIQGFFNIPVDELTAVHLLSNYFRQKHLENLVVVTDLGFAKRARSFAELLDAPLAIIEKRRVGNLDRAEVMNVIGEVRGRRAIFVDDEIDTAGTLLEVVRALQREGVEEIYACATHGILSDNAVDRIAASGLQEVVLTDSIPLPLEKRLPQITTLSVAPLIGEAIRRIHRGESVGALFSSEVTLTQEMILWEDGVEHTIDARTGQHMDGQDALAELGSAVALTTPAPPAGIAPASNPGDR